MSKHAFLSASGAPGWMRCPAKPIREKNYPDPYSEYAAEGTAAHELLQHALMIGDIKVTPTLTDLFESDPKWFTAEMEEEVQKTVDLVNSLKTKSTMMYCEQELPLEFLTGEAGATCTADVILCDKKKLTVIDLKYGKGVQVDAPNNEQLLIYAICAIHKFMIPNKVKTVEMIISQPRLNHTSRWEITYAELQKYMMDISGKAGKILGAVRYSLDLEAVPGDKQCAFCRHKADCKELRNHNFDIITLDFKGIEETSLPNKIEASTYNIHMTSDENLATYAENVDLIRTWCDAVQDELKARLRTGLLRDPRYKLVQGRPGNRKFDKVEDIEEICFEHNALDIYDRKLLSPTQLEKKYTKKAYPVMWAKLDALVMRSEGQPTVVKYDDPRPALNMVLDFEPIEDEPMADALLGLSTDVKK